MTGATDMKSTVESRHDHTPKIGTDRTFGLVFCVLFLGIGLWPLVNGKTAFLWALAISGVFCLLAAIHPRALGPLNRLWFHFGLLLGRVMNPIILGIMFIVAVTPIALLMRALGKRPLSLRFDPDAPTYWLPRTPPGPSGESLKNQF